MSRIASDRLAARAGNTRSWRRRALTLAVSLALAPLAGCQSIGQSIGLSSTTETIPGVIAAEATRGASRGGNSTASSSSARRSSRRNVTSNATLSDAEPETRSPNGIAQVAYLQESSEEPAKFRDQDATPVAPSAKSGDKTGNTDGTDNTDSTAQPEKPETTDDLGAPAEEVPAPTAPRPSLELAPGAKKPDPRPLSLREVSESVYSSFPALEAAMREIDIAEGKATSALGEFDLKLKAESMSAPEGFYQTYRNLVKLEQALYPGGYVFGQYRIGDGNFQPWYGERETNEGGEFKVAWVTPLLRDRRIDDRRAELFKATIRRQQVDPNVQAQLLEYVLAASEAYWTWVAAGLSYDAQRELLRVTVERNRVYEERVKQEDLAKIELVQNQRLIASREAKVIEAQRKLQISAIKLSLYLRDEQGNPVVPPPTLLPAKFPTPPPPPSVAVAQDIDRALNNRPELVELNLQRQQYEVDLAHGENMRLPYLSATFEAAKDVGAPASSKGDKTPFELEAGLLFDVPLQRRKADGKIREAYGKLAQLSAKRRLVENKIAIQVQDVHSALATSYAQWGRAVENHRLAKELEIAERKRFDAEDSDLLRVAIQEGAEIEAALSVIDTLSEYFKAEAAYRAAVAADPLADE